MCHVLCLELKNKLRKRFLTWKSSGNSSVAGQQLMVAIYPWNALLGPRGWKEYHNFKKFYPTVLMGMVDQITDSNREVVAFQEIRMMQSFLNLLTCGTQFRGVHSIDWQKCRWYQCPTINSIRFCISLQTWLIRPFCNAVLSPCQQYFNYWSSRVQMVTEGAYGQMKGRWRVPLRKSESCCDHICF